MRRVGAAELTQLTQPHFELLLVPLAARARHEVDFVTVELGPQRVLHVRPGQVQRWILQPVYEAIVVLFPALRSRADWRAGPHIIELSEGRAADLAHLLQVGLQERRSRPLSGGALDGLRRMVVSELDLDRSGEEGGDPLYLDFCRAIERDGYVIRNVEYYARELGCSMRTLARACHRDAGASPKHILDEQTTLAAQRMLRLPGATVTSVGDQLGFGELTNFTKFFKRIAGVTPSEWRIAEASAPVV